MKKQQKQRPLLSKPRSGKARLINKRKKRRKIPRLLCAGALTIVLGVLLYQAYIWNLLPKRSYAAADFNIPTSVSIIDYNHNGVDDYADLLLGARDDAEKHPRYDGSYYAGGYPPPEIGVCTDVVWRAFRQAGYSLKDMVDADIRRRPEAYPTISQPDGNIDFRRVDNLRVFFAQYAENLTTDITRIDQWQPGDIVVFGDDQHIAIVSDRRNKNGRPYFIHNGGQPMREEDYLVRTALAVTGHYRFNAAVIDEAALIAWQD